MLRLFISSVQKEFASERAALRSNVDVVGSIAAQPESRPESQPESLAVRIPGDMIERCRRAGRPEPEFALTDGSVMTLRRRPETAFITVGGQVAGQVTPPVTPPVAPPVAGQVTGQVTEQVAEEARCVVLVLRGEKSRKQLREGLFLKGRTNFEDRYLKPAIEAGLVEPTIPDQPNSRLQKYRLNAKGRAALSALQPKGAHECPPPTFRRAIAAVAG